MYVRTPRALVWVDQVPNQVQSVPKTPAKNPTPPQERWAKYPLHIERGRCVAVRLNAGQLELGCMVDKRLLWLAEPQQAVSHRRLQAWLREGF
jgi:hypothetical protein